MDAIARQAGITRLTIYHHFDSKRRLLEALFDDTAARGGLSERLPAVFSQRDPDDALHGYVASFCDFWESERSLNRRLRGFALLDEEFAAAIASRNRRREAAADALIRRLKGYAVAPCAAEHPERVHTLRALTSFEFYDGLAGQLGPQKAARITLRLARAALGVPSP